MKGAGKYAEELKSLVKKFAKEGKSSPIQKQNPLRAMTRAIFAFDTTEAKADEAMAIVDREFVDINELRVATELEVHDLIGEKYPQISRRATMINAIFNHLFDKEGVLSFDRLGAMKKAEIRQFLKSLPGISPYVEGYVALTAFDISAMPLDEMSLAHLKHSGAIEASASLEEAQKFIEGHAKPEEIQELFAGLRRHAKETFAPAVEESKPRKKK